MRPEPTVPELVARALTASVPVFGSGLEIALGAALDRRRARATDFGAALAVEIDTGTLTARLTADADAGELFLRAIEAAQRTRLSEARSAMGRAVGAALKGDVFIDEVALRIDCLVDLDAAHVALLTELARHEDLGRRDLEGTSRPMARGQLSGEHRKSRDDIASRYPAAVHSKLFQHGLVISDGMSFQSIQKAAWATPTGWDLLRSLHGPANEWKSLDEAADERRNASS